MTTKLVVVPIDELGELIRSAVAEALRSTGHGRADWVDARTSGLEPRAFRRLAREKAFPTYRLGRKLVAKRSDVDAWIESRPRCAETDRPEEAPPDPLARALAAGNLRVVGGAKR